MRDLVQFVRQLWEDRMSSVEEFTKNNDLSVEEALKLRNQELEGCMKDLEHQTDALLDALEEADSLLASPRTANEKLNRKLALGECLKRLGKQEEEASLSYDDEKVAFLQQARQLLIESFENDSPVLSEAEEDGEKEDVQIESVTMEVAETENAAEDEVEKEEFRNVEIEKEEPETEIIVETEDRSAVELLGVDHLRAVELCLKTPTEEQMMQTDATVNEEAATQTRRIVLRKVRIVKQRADSGCAPGQPAAGAAAAALADRSPSPVKVASADPAGVQSAPPDSEPTGRKTRKKSRRSLSPRFINERLGIRAPSPRRRPLPWERATVEEDAGYSSTELTPPPPPPPPPPPQRHNSHASLPDADADDDMQGFITAEENPCPDRKQKAKSKSKSPKGKRKKNASKSPKRQEAEAEAAASAVDLKSARSARSVEPASTAADMGAHGEGARPRRRRSNTKRSQKKASGGEPLASSDDEAAEEQRRRPTAEPHGDGSRGPRRRSAARSPAKSQTSPGRGATAAAATAARRPAGSPPRRLTNSHVYQLTSLPQPDDPLAGLAAAASAASDTKLMSELGAKQRAGQPRSVRRKRCCGGGDTMSVQSNSTEDSRGRPESARQLGRTPPQLLSHMPPPEMGAVGGDDPRHGHHNPAAGFPWDTSHLVYQPDPFCAGAAGGADAAATESAQDMWAYRMRSRSGEPVELLPLGDGLATDDAKARHAAGDDAGFPAEPAARSLSSFRSEPYVPPLRLQQTPDSAARPKSESDMSFAQEASATASADSQLTASRRSPRSPSRCRLLTNAAPLERSNSCEVPHKKQRRSDERPSASPLQLTGSGDMAIPTQAAAGHDRSLPAPPPAAVPASVAPPVSSEPPTPAPPPPTPAPTPALQTQQRTSTAAAAAEATAAAGDSPSPRSPLSAAKLSEPGSSDYQECEPAPAAAAAAAEPPLPPLQPQAPIADDHLTDMMPLSPAVLVHGYEQLQESLAELKDLQTKFQQDFAANEHAKEMTVDLQADIQRLESSIQELQGIVSQEYEQTRQDHDETRAAIAAIESRVDTSERSTQGQLDDLRKRLEMISEKVGRIEDDLKKDKVSRNKDGLTAPNVVTLSSMLTRLETEVITLRREVDSNRVSLDSITSVTQLDSPKPSPVSAGVVSSDWQPTPGRTDRTDASKDSASVPTAAAARPADAPDTAATATSQAPPPPPEPEPETPNKSAASTTQPRPRPPEDLDSFRDSQSEVSVSETTSLGDRLTGRRSPTPAPARAAVDCQQPGKTPLRDAADDQHRRPPAVSPLRMGRRRSGSGSSHIPDVTLQLLQGRHRTPPRRPGAAKRSRSALPQGTREESDELRDYWAQDLSTASASTEPPLNDESTRAHHGSSRAPSRPGDGSHAKSAASTHNSEAFLAKIDALVDPADKLDYLQNKLLDLRHRVLLSMYRRQRRRAISESARGSRDQQRRRAQLAAIDRRLRQRIHGWNKRLLNDDQPGRSASFSSTGEGVSEESSSGHSEVTYEEVGGGRQKAAQPTVVTRRAATEYLSQLSRLLATGPEGARDGSRGRHRSRPSHSPPTKDPSSTASTRRSRRHPPPPVPPVDMDGSQMQRFARSESKLAELQSYLGGIRQHLQKMALDLESPPSRPRASSSQRGAPAPAAAQGVVFAPWRHEQTARGRSASRRRRAADRRPTFAVPLVMHY